VHLLEVHLQQEEVLMETHLQEALIVQATLLPDHQEVVQQEVHLLEVHLHQEVLPLQVEEEITNILFN
jgi:hypothetical protein